MNNIIFYFSGTGNSLYTAIKIAESLENCEIFPMKPDTPKTIDKKYERIGFVYPTYYTGLPLAVSMFIDNLTFNSHKRRYFFAITTHGGVYGNALYQMSEKLKKKNINLSYASDLMMAANFIAKYDLPSYALKANNNSVERLEIIINELKNKHIYYPKKNPIYFSVFYKIYIGMVNKKDRFFNINNDCVSCGICKKVCPVNNIYLKKGRPRYKGKCEQCMACIQFCPEKAINYKDITQNRTRYAHPEINYQKLSAYNSIDLLNTHI